MRSTIPLGLRRDGAPFAAQMTPALDAPLDINCDAATLIKGVVRIVIIPGASHLFEADGTLTEAAIEAGE
jgi:hypothetical protein